MKASKEKEIVLKAKEYIMAWLKQMGLALKAEKTRVCHTYLPLQDTKPGFKFLGFDIRPYRSPSSKSGYKTLE